MKRKVYVTLKEGVLDPQGEAVKGTLGRMGYSGVKNVRIGKYIEVEFDGQKDAEHLDEMCKKLLANLVMENYRIE